MRWCIGLFALIGRGRNGRRSSSYRCYLDFLPPLIKAKLVRYVFIRGFFFFDDLEEEDDKMMMLFCLFVLDSDNT